ncbi:MAG TPA: hypothetical protein VGG74_36795 [Kofleriaceae bacterium]
MRSTLVLAIVLVATAVRAQPGDDNDDDPEATDDTLPAIAALGSAGSLVAEGRRELAAVHESHYAHHTVVDESRGVFDYDCSGFVGYALARVAPKALAAVTAATRARPLAKDFYAFIAQPHAPWHRIDRVAELVPGDVIAWLEPPSKHSRNTGHVMIVESSPAPGARAGEYAVSVMDSSHSGHGSHDARVHDHRNGLGVGSIVLLVDDSGRPIGYRWSLAAHSVAYSTAIALGRPI